MFLTLLRKVGSWYNHLEEMLLVLLVFGMVALGAIQIIVRNVLSMGIVWIDPVIRHLVLWVALLGASVATRDDRHITIEVLPARLSPAVRARIKAGLQLFSALVCLFLVRPAVRFILDDYQPGKELALGIPLWVSQAIMPFMWLVLGIRFLLQGIKNLMPVRRD